MKELADPNHDWMHEGRNPSVKYDMDFLTGKKSFEETSGELQVGGELEDFHQRFFEVCEG